MLEVSRPVYLVKVNLSEKVEGSDAPGCSVRGWNTSHLLPSVFPGEQRGPAGPLGLANPPVTSPVASARPEFPAVVLSIFRD